MRDLLLLHDNSFDSILLLKRSKLFVFKGLLKFVVFYLTEWLGKGQSLILFSYLSLSQPSLFQKMKKEENLGHEIEQR